MQNVMENIVENITQNKIDWDQLVDQTNGTLHYLAYNGKNDLIEAIQDLPKIILQKNLEGDTIGHIASKLKNDSLLKLAIRTDPNIIYSQNTISNTPLHYIAPHKQLVREIVLENRIHDHPLNKDYSFIEYYILSKDMEMTSFLLENLVLNSVTHSAPFTLLQSLNGFDDKKTLLKKFFQRDIGINTLNSQYLTLLILATNQQDKPMVQFLLENGADVNYSGPEDSHNPLSLAIKKSDPELLHLLWEADPKLNIRDKYLQTPVHYAMVNDSIPLIWKKRLVQKIKNINMVNNNMDSVLNLLVHHNNWKLYSKLLQNKKLKIYLANKQGLRPIDFVKDLKPFLEIVSRIPSQKKAPLELILAPEININHFSSYTHNYICFLLYLLRKYPTIKIPLLPDPIKNQPPSFLYQSLTQDFAKNLDKTSLKIIKEYLNHCPSLINHLIIWKNAKTNFISKYLAKSIEETIGKYPKTQFIVMKLSIGVAKDNNHANFLIYDVDNRSIERFDPYGHIPFLDNEGIDNFLQTYISENLLGVAYIPPSKLFDGVSFQIFSDESNDMNYVENDPKGFCVAWCFLYAESRIKNHSIRPTKLIRKMTYQINKTSDSFKSYIRNYSNYLDSEKNMIMEKASVPRTYWYTMYIPKEIFRLYLKYIRRTYDAVL